MKTIPLTRGLVAIVDDDVYEWASKMHWQSYPNRQSNPNVYAGGFTIRNGRRAKIYLHREVVGAPRGIEVDHINGNTLDNRRQNLRTATRAQNARNSKIPAKRASRHSCYKGVYWSNRSGKWQAYITVNRQRIHLGFFDDEVLAAQAYDARARIESGAFARLNFP